MVKHHDMPQKKTKKTRGGAKTGFRVEPCSASRVDLLGVLEMNRVQVNPEFHGKTRVQLYPIHEKTRVHLEVQGEPEIWYTEKCALGKLQGSFVQGDFKW